MMFANGQPEAWIPKSYQATPDITAWIPIAETNRGRKEKEAIIGHFLYAKQWGRGVKRVCW